MKVQCSDRDIHRAGGEFDLRKVLIQALHIRQPIPLEPFCHRFVVGAIAKFQHPRRVLGVDPSLSLHRQGKHLSVVATRGDQIDDGHSRRDAEKNDNVPRLSVLVAFLVRLRTVARCEALGET